MDICNIVWGIVYYLKELLIVLTLAVTAQLTPHRKYYKISKLEIWLDGNNIRLIMRAYMCRKDDFSGKDAEP